MWKFALITVATLAITITSTLAVPECPVNAVFDECPSPCPPRTCATKNIQVKCIAPLEVGDPNCPAAKCRCQDGYYSDDDGNCVTYEECPPVCPQNEVYELCPIPCPPRNCNTSDIFFSCLAGPTYPDPACPTPVCRCDDGFFRNDDGNCVAKEECPIQVVCPTNEVYDLCPASCPPRTCASKDAQFKCIAPLEVGDPNCAPAACRCEEGFYRNYDGNCVTKEQCGDCPENEVYDLCPNPCPPRFCNTSVLLYSCLAGPTYPDSACPTPVCRCDDGFYRNDDGNCVDKEECSSQKCLKPNEVWATCPPSNPLQTCDYLNGYTSKSNVHVINRRCRAQCQCVEGYYRNSIGDCITKERCLQCPGPNEYYSCGGACDNVCETLSQQNQTSCPIINIRCNDKCYCDDGYARNSKGICVPYAECESKSTCDKKAASSKSRTRTTRSPVECSSEEVQQDTSNFAKGNDQFSADFYSELSKEKPSQSTISSPYSLLFLLAQLVLYTTGVSHDQLISALGLASDFQVRCTFPVLLSDIASQTDVTFDLATKVYSNVGNNLSANYIADSRDVFRSEAEVLDFSQSAQAAQTINDWVAKNTNNKITDLVSASAFSSLTRLVLVNALYFNGKWQKAFNVNSTKDSPFYVSSTETKSVPTMTQKSNFLYASSDELDCQILSMPYSGGKFSFVIFLPNQQDGLSALQDKMRNVSAVETAVSSATNVSITVYIPKFTITTTIDLTELLGQIGITQIFNQSDSGISGLLESPEVVYVSAAIQKAFIDVSEAGTEATAANTIVLTSRALPLPREFRANRPFVYQIVFENDPVFIGTYLGPA